MTAVIGGNGNSNNENTVIDAEKLLWPPPHGQYNCYVNSLSSRQMDSLTAICDSFLPSLHPVSADSSDVSAAVATFYLSSASMAATPQRVSTYVISLLLGS